LRDLRGERDVPLLQALLDEGSAWVARVTGQSPDEVSFHYPLAGV
jgi:hypothetical protein